MVVQIKSLDTQNIAIELARPANGASQEVLDTVKTIVDNVQARGDAALIEYPREFDGIRFSPAELSVSVAERDEALERISEEVVAALELAAARIKKFHLRQLPESWMDTVDGAEVGQVITPIGRAGLYVPGGSANYPSSVLMNAIPAQIAGVTDIALCVPPDKDGKVSDYTLAAAAIIGVKEIYRVGGAQAIAAMAFGTETIKRVDKIAGPGNIYVATAKKMVIGAVDIDMIAGPTEIVIVADEGAKPDFIAADMIAQAEHDRLATSILITDSAALGQSVKEALFDQLKSAARADIARHSLREQGRIYIVDNLDIAFEFVNKFAPEHLEIMTANPREALPEVKNAGAIFLGDYTPEALGDYIAGSNHVLPTGSTARFYSPLGVYDFVKWSTVLSFSKSAISKIGEEAMVIADIEGLSGHGNSVKIRLDEAED